MEIDTKAVLEAAGTKWNFLKFTPGLVGGHCIAVDPYYFIYKAEQLGYHSQLIMAGRKINDDMGKYVAANTVKQMIKADQHIKGAKVAIFGMTFKENCSDARNTRVVDIIRELQDYGIRVFVYDPIADKEEVWEEYKINLIDKDDLKDLNCIVIAVAHNVFKEEFTLDVLDGLYSDCRKVLIDVKGILNEKECLDRGYVYWRL